jgi:hypothetical protein
VIEGNPDPEHISTSSCFPAWIGTEARMSGWDKLGYSVAASGLIPAAAFAATWFMPDGAARDLVGMTFVYGFMIWFALFAVFGITGAILRMLGRIP